MNAAATRQRGIALLTAIILVAIAAVVATAIAYNNAMTARRVAATFGAEQALQMAEGAEALAAYVLQQQSQNSGGQIAANGAWAQHYGPTNFDGALLEAQLEDEQGKFNVNNLITQAGASNPVTVEQFQRLLAAVGLETRWAGLLADWIDTDNEPNSPDGAEDSVYLGQTPPYRTANMPISSVSELLALPGFGRDRYNRIVPYISALPVGTPINVCTAPGVVLDALTPGQQEFGLDPKELAMRREDGCFPTLAEFTTGISQTAANQLNGLVGETSSYFRLHSWITIGSARFSLYSLMYLDGGQARPILRTFGTE